MACTRGQKDQSHVNIFYIYKGIKDDLKRGISLEEEEVVGKNMRRILEIL